MKYTREELDEFKNDPVVRFVAGLLGTDINDIVENAKKELEQNKEDSVDKKTNDIDTQNVKSRLEETLRRMERDGLIHNLHINNQPIQNKKKEYEAPKCNVKSFIMSREQFVKFINNYIELINNVAKSRYLFGLSFDNSDCRYNIAEAIRGIIWDFVRLIFGDDNADDIADFVYGNSNFDSPEKLYDELI